ncbi:hypothetical protein H6503_03305 [Candidatus Woesearchaeota archaeon]|nr:hypothetical protein [Candidatus Woesearchaeota archaeon]
MDTVKSNPNDGMNEERKKILLQKKERIEKIKEFLNLKVKIFRLINLKRLNEAKETYHNLYIIYEEIIHNSNEREAVKFQSDISTIYSKLMAASNEKSVKKREEPDKDEKKQAKKKIVKKVITTDLDMIIKIVEDKGRMSLSDIQSTFNISRRLAEEWVQVLADYGLVEIRYLPVGGIEIVRVRNTQNG